MDKLFQIPLNMFKSDTELLKDNSAYTKDMLISLINSDIYKSNSNLKRFLYVIKEMKQTIDNYNTEYQNETKLNLLSQLDEISYLDIKQKLFLTTILTSFELPIEFTKEDKKQINEEIGQI